MVYIIVRVVKLVIFKVEYYHIGLWFV